MFSFNSISRLGLSRLAISRLFISGLIMASMAGFSHAQSNDANDQNLIVEADNSLQWLRDEKKYIATGNASATRAGTRLDADVIIADYLESETADAEGGTTITHIEGQKNARFTRGSMIATGENITYDLTTENAVMTGQNSTIVNGAETLTATKSITYDRSQRIITATGDAYVQLSNGQELKAMVITATLNEDENDITVVTADGNAQVFSPSRNQADSGIREAYADAMTYEKATGIAVLTDNVLLKEAGNILKGDKAVIDTIAGTSTMSSTTSGKRVGGVFQPAN